MLILEDKPGSKAPRKGFLYLEIFMKTLNKLLRNKVSNCYNKAKKKNSDFKTIFDFFIYKYLCRYFSTEMYSWSSDCVYSHFNNKSSIRDL